MKAYLLTFDQDHFKFDYVKIHDKLTAYPKLKDWFHFLHSSYILISSDSVGNIGQYIRKSVMPNHQFLLVEIDLAVREGWLPKEAWDWISHNRILIALSEIKQKKS